MEYEVSLVAVLFLSILTALTAKYNLLTVPWIEVLKKPKYFGGKKEIGRGIVYLIAWIVCSLLLSIVITFTLKNSSGIAKSVYKFIGYDDPTAGSAGLITTLLFNVAIYLFLVNKTKRVLKEESENPPEDLLENNNIHNTEDDEIFKNRTNTVHVLLRKLYYFIPKLMAHIYRYFYLESNHLVQGSARLIFDTYGKETILNFFQSHIDNSRLMPNAKKSRITMLSDRLIKNKINGYDRAFALLERKIEIKGYFSTKKFINNYLERAREERRYKENRRAFARVPARGKKVVSLINGDGVLEVLIPEYSKDYSGLYLSTDVAININQPIIMLINDDRLELKVVHKNALTSCNKTHSGCGARVIDESAKDVLSKYFSV